MPEKFLDKKKALERIDMQSSKSDEIRGYVFECDGEYYPVKETNGLIVDGCMSLRDPKTGAFLPAVQLYTKATPEARESESVLTGDIARLFAGKMNQYVDETGGRFG